jgi:hypothetical protein
VYVPRVTFSSIAEQGKQIDPATLSKLPAYTDEIKPAGGGNYRLLKNEPGGQTVSGLEPGEYLVDDSGKVVYRVQNNFPKELRANPAYLGRTEKLEGPQSGADSNTYRTFHKSDTVGGPAGKYLVDDRGVPVYFVDPGINGIHRTRPDGSSVTKYDAPKATLMSYIIKGILNRQLPWGLVLLGVMIAIVLEMSGIPSLAFAVGVYLPLSSSSPIFLGGMIRWLVDRYLRLKFKDKSLSEEEFVAETDKSPGVLMASGYIAGGALAAVFIAFFAGVLENQNRAVETWSKANNRFFEGPYSDVLSLIPFAILMVLLYMTGRELILSGKRSRS